MIITRMWTALLAIAGAALAACGQTGQLYLPDAPGEVVTRPAATTPAGNTSAPDSPQTADSPSEPSTPAPEVTAPVVTPEAEESRKEKGAAASPPPQ